MAEKLPSPLGLVEALTKRWFPREVKVTVLEEVSEAETLPKRGEVASGPPLTVITLLTTWARVMFNSTRVPGAVSITH